MVEDQMQADTDAGMFAAMFDRATPEEWAEFAALLLTAR